MTYTFTAKIPNIKGTPLLVDLAPAGECQQISVDGAGPVYTVTFEADKKPDLSLVAGVTDIKEL